MLDELVDTIETLKARISEHATVLRASEAQTRLSLIDPLLRALGWDTANPALVRPEYILSGGRADYALLGADEKPVAVMEAKRLNEPLGTTDRQMQMLTYANFSGVSFAGLTDGDKWVLYRVFDQRPLADRLVLDISLADSPAYESALKLLLLWRPNLESGQPIEASEPILGIETPDPIPSEPIQTDPPNSASAPEAGWITLEELKGQKGMPHPPRVRLPNGEERDVTSWRGLFVEVAEWLVRKGSLTENECPVRRGPNSWSCLVNSLPKHPGGADFYEPHKLSNGLFIAANGGAVELARRSRSIMEYLGKDPATVHVQID